MTNPLELYNGLFYNKDDGGPTAGTAFRIAPYGATERDGLKLTRQAGGPGSEVKLDKKGHDKFVSLDGATTYEFKRNSAGAIVHVKETPTGIPFSLTFDKVAGSEKPGGGGTPGAAQGASGSGEQKKGADGKDAGPKPLDAKELRELALKKQRDDDAGARKLYAPLHALPPLFNALLAKAAEFTAAAASTGADAGAARTAASAAEKELLTKIAAHSPEVLSAAWTLIASSASDDTLHALSLSFVRHIALGATMLTGLWTALRETARFASLRSLSPVVLDPLLAATSDWELDPPVPRAPAPVPDAKAAPAPVAAAAPADAKALADAMAASQPPPQGYHRSPLSGLIMSPPVLALECVLLGYQHAPDLFLPSLPALMALVDVSGDGTRDRLALVHIIRCAMHVFSGYDAVYDVVRPQLNEHAPNPPRTFLQTTLYNAQWLVPTPASSLSVPLPAAAVAATPAAATPAPAAAAAAAAKPADRKAEAKAEAAAPAPAAAAAAAAVQLTPANVAAIAALADPNIATTSASAGWVEGEYTSKAAGGAMRWTLSANVQGTAVRGSWRRVHGKTRPGQGMIISPALGGSGVRDLDPITHTTQLAGFKKNGLCIALAGDGNTAHYFAAHIQDARQDEFQIKILTKEPRWCTTDQLLYDAPLPAIDSIVDGLNKPQPERLFVLAKRGITDQHYVRGLLVKAEPPKQLVIKPGEAPYQLREQLTVRFSSDRKEELISRDRIRLYKPCYTRVRGELDAGAVSGVLHRTSSGKAVVLGVRRQLTNGAPSTFEAQLSEYEGKPAAATPRTGVWEEGMTARWAHGDEEYATDVAVRSRIAPDNRVVLAAAQLDSAVAQQPAAQTTLRAAQLVRMGDGTYVHCGADTALAFHEQQPFTVEAIVRLRRDESDDKGLDKKVSADAAGTFYTIVSKFNKGFGPADWKLALNEKRQVLWLGAPATDVSLEYERWYHVAGVYDGVRAYVYVDGVSVREADLKAADAVTPANAYAPVTIGAAQNAGVKGGQDAFPGNVCEVRVWGEARSAANIAAFARRRLNGYESGLLGYWPLTSLFGLCDDASLLQHHGVLTTGTADNSVAKGVRQWDDVPAAGGGNARPPVSDHFHTRVNDFLFAGAVDVRAGASQHGGIVLPLVAPAASAASTGAALWAAPATQQVSDGAAVWSRTKLALLTGFRSELVFRARAAGEVTSFALHLNLRAFPAIVPVPPRPPLAKLPSAVAGQPTFVAAPVPFSPYFASAPTAPLITGLSVAVTVRALEWSAADGVPAGVEVERVTVQVYTTSALGAFQTLAASTHDVLVTAASRHNNTCVVDYEVGVHQLTVSRNGRVLLTHKQNLLAVLMAEKHDSTVYAGVSSGAVAHLLDAGGAADAKLPAVLPQTSPLQQWTMEGGKAFGNADKALAHPDDEKVWLSHTMTQLKELEKWMRGSVHSNGWKCSRLEWLDAVNAVSNVKDAVQVLLTLFANILWSNKWEKPDRDKWEKEFTSTCTTLADFCKALVFFEDRLPLDAMFGPWKGNLNNIPDNRGLLLAALQNIKETDHHRRRVVELAKKLRTTVTNLGLFDDREKKAAAAPSADEKAAKDGKAAADAKPVPAPSTSPAPGGGAGAPAAAAADTAVPVTGEAADASFVEAERLAVCTYALRRCDDDLVRASNWLVDKQPTVRAYVTHRVFENAARRHWLGAAHSIDNNTLVDSDHPAPAIDISGDWDGTRGYLQLVNEQPFVGKLATASFPLGDGRCRGFLSRNVAGGWRFDGVLTQTLYRFPAVAQFEFSEGGGKMHGFVFYGGSVGTEWNADKVSDYTQRSKEGFAGLVNLGNTCYQNSFLQSLFMTKQLRQSLLSIPLTAYPSATKAEREAKQKALADAKAAEAKDKKSVPPPKKDGDEILTDPKLVLQRLQSVFAALQLSQRSTVNQLPLKSLVKKPYCADKQDDSREYGSYLLGQFEEALKGTPHADLAKSVFGGKIRNVSRCQECGATRAREDTINELAVSFPKLYAPITHMTVIVSKDTSVAAPEGYEKIPIDMNSGRPRATNPHMYFCVKREPGAPPITELFFWYADDKTEIKGREGQEILPYNLNDGGVDKGANIRLSYRRSHTTGNPVTQLTFLDSEKAQPPAGFVKLEFDISKGQANKPLYMCYKRGLPLRDIKLTTAPTREEAVALLPEGYDTFGTDLNVKPHEGHRMKVWIGFRSGGTGLPITDLSVRLSPPGPPSTHPPLPKNVTAEGYMIGATSLDLLITRGHGTPIVGMEVFRAPQQFKPFSDMEKLDLAPHLAAANGDEKIDPYTGLTNAPWPMDSGDTIVWDTRQDRSAPQQFDCHLIEGKYETQDGKVEGILFPRLERSNIPGMAAEWKWVMQGVWKQNNYKVRQPFELVFADDNFSSFRGTYMYGTGEGDWTGNRKSGPVDDKKDDKKGGATSVESNATAPIVGVCVIPKGANPPPGYVKVTKTPAGNDAQLDAAGHYLCILRGPEPKEEPKKAAAEPAAAAPAKPADGAAAAKDGKDAKDGKAGDDKKAQQQQQQSGAKPPGAAAGSDDDALAQALALSAAEANAAAAAAPPKPPADHPTAAPPATTTPAAAPAAATPAATPVAAAAGPEPITDFVVLAAELDSVPPGYEEVKVVVSGGGKPQPDVRYECKGGDVPLLLYVSRKPAAPNKDGDEKKVLWDLQLVWGTERTPSGFTKIADTPVSMPADLASNGTFAGGKAHQLFVAVHKSVPKSKEQIAAEKAAQDKPAPHPVEGVYTSNFGVTTLKVVGNTQKTPLKGWLQQGKYKGGGGGVAGVMFNTKPPGVGGGHVRFMGTYSKPNQKYPGVCIWDFDGKLSEVKGNGSFNETQFTWNGCKDCYVHLGLTRNYRSYWQHGIEQFGGTATAADLKAAGVTDKQLAAMPQAAAGNHISSMVQAYFNPEVLDRANWLQCDSSVCKKKPTPHERHPCVRVAPTHLMCVIKRFEFDYRLQAIKILDAVDFDAVLHLPVPAPDLSRVVFENDQEKAAVADNAYGLYAVVVHVGTKLEGGHYYCYARDSDSDLTKDDNETDGTPWTRYDDTRITRTTWKGLKETLRKSASDTAYILFYRRVDARAQQLMTEQMRAPGLNRAVTRLGEIVGSPRGGGAAAAADAKQKNAPAPPPAEESEKASVPAPAAAAAAAAAPQVAAAAGAPAAAAAPTAGPAPPPPPPPHVSASLVELLRRDNTRYLDELQSYTTPHFWQHINASVRAHTRLTGAWSVSAPAGAAGAVVALPAGGAAVVVGAPVAAGSGAGGAGAAAGAAAADAKVCGICRGPAHGKHAPPCVFERFSVVQCPDCHLHLTKAQYAKHFVVVAAAGPTTTTGAATTTVCATSLSWSGAPNLTQPEADVDSRPVGGAGAGPGGASSYSNSSSSSSSSSSSGGTSNGSSGAGGDAGAGGPPGGGPPPLQRAVSVFTCPTCQAVIPGSQEFAAHLSKTGH